MYQSIIIGHLGADAEVGQSNGRDYVRFRVASSRTYTDSNGQQHDETQWFSCIMSGDGGALLAYLKRGQLVAVIGHTSLKVVSSPKQRRMIATADINVQSIELLGSSARDDVPKSLATPDGLIVDVTKYFHVPEEAVRPHIKEGEQQTLFFGQRGDAYNVDVNGWVWPAQQQSQQDNAQQSDGQQSELEGVQPADNGILPNPLGDVS